MHDDDNSKPRQGGGRGGVCVENCSRVCVDGWMDGWVDGWVDACMRLSSLLDSRTGRHDEHQQTESLDGRFDPRPILSQFLARRFPFNGKSRTRSIWLRGAILAPQLRQAERSWRGGRPGVRRGGRGAGVPGPGALGGEGRREPSGRTSEGRNRVAASRGHPHDEGTGSL